MRKNKILAMSHTAFYHSALLITNSPPPHYSKYVLFFFEGATHLVPLIL